jgi:hypothetical protein
LAGIPSILDILSPEIRQETPTQEATRLRREGLISDEEFRARVQNAVSPTPMEIQETPLMPVPLAKFFPFCWVSITDQVGGDGDDTDNSNAGHDDNRSQASSFTIPGDVIIDYSSLQVGMFVLAKCGEGEKHRFPAEIMAIDETAEVFQVKFYHFPKPGSMTGFSEELVTRPALASDILSVLKPPKVEYITAKRNKITFEEL